MALSPLCDSVVPTRNMKYSSRYGVSPRLVVIHDMEAPITLNRAWNVGVWFSDPDGDGQPRSSAHYGVDNWATVGYLDEAHMAWAAPGANTDGVQVEQAGYARWSRAQWLAMGTPMIERTGLLVADICARLGITPRWLTNDQLAAGWSGICHHLQVTQVYRRGDHWDCGYSYPNDVLMAHVLGSSPVGPGPVHPISSVEAETMRVQAHYRGQYEVAPGIGGHVYAVPYIPEQGKEYRLPTATKLAVASSFVEIMFENDGAGGDWVWVLWGGGVEALRWNGPVGAPGDPVDHFTPPPDGGGYVRVVSPQPAFVSAEWTLVPAA